MTIETVLIAAIAANGVIGRDGTMPWRLKSDMRHFRSLTLGKPVVMGRKTFLSLSIKPLPGRTNIVVSRDPAFTAPGISVARDLATALAMARADAMRRGTDAIMVIGGADIYAQTMPLAARLEITRIRMDAAGDAHFPPIDAAMWRETARTERMAGEGDDAPFDTVTYVRT
jgi:dihydrofolate reductase